MALGNRVFPRSHRGKTQAHQVRSRCGTTPGAGRRTPGHAGARLPVQDYTSGPQGLHAPVPHERRRAAQARPGPVRGTDGRTGPLAGTGMAGRGTPGRRPQRGQGRRPFSPHGQGTVHQVHGGLLQTAQQAQHPAWVSGRHRPLHRSDAGPFEGSGRKAAGRDHGDEEDGPQAGRG